MTARLVPQRRRTADAAIVLTALVAGAASGAAARAGAPAVLAGATLGVVGALASASDVRARRIPNRVVAAGALVAAVIGVLVEVLGDRSVAASMAAGAALAAGPLFAGHLVRPDGIGFGDVKLAVVLGALLGVVHWVLAAAMLGLASLLGILGAAAWSSWRRSIPFGACMALAALVALAAADWLHHRWGLW